MEDPSIDLRPPRRPGRPNRTSMSVLIGAAIELGLDRFTLAAVAARTEVAESTVYGYVASRGELFTAAAGQVFEELDIAVEATSWPEFVDRIAQRTAELAGRHPGLRDYVLWGPHAPSTIATFEALVAGIGHWLPDVPDHVAWLLASRPIVQTLTYAGDPVLEPLAPWLRRALLTGLAALVDADDLPPAPPVPWRTKLQRT